MRVERGGQRERERLAALEGLVQRGITNVKALSSLQIPNNLKITYARTRVLPYARTRLLQFDYNWSHLIFNNLH